MRRIVNWSAVGAAALLTLAAVARADDKAEKLSLDKAPKAVRDAILGRFPGADVTSIEKETEDGKVVYDVELKHQGRKYEMDLHEDGTIFEIEKEVASKDVPPGVNHAVRKMYPNAKITEVMEVNKVSGKKETPIHYEVTIESGGKKQELIVSLDGKSVKTEAEEKKEKEKEKEKK